MPESVIFQEKSFMSSSPDVVIVGAGPYGLSIAAHLRFHGIRFRIFGSSLSVWRRHMPEGMHLKSDGFASNLSDPESRLTLKHYCEQAGVLYHDTAIPVRLNTFIEYGDAFQKALVPTLEDAQVTAIEQNSGRFHVQLNTAEQIETRNVVLAVGISRFAHIPQVLEGLPSEILSHSFAHRSVERFRGKDVTVVGAGASAMDLAALLLEFGANVTVVARRRAISFNQPGLAAPRSILERIRHPSSGLGPSLQGWFYSNYPQVFHSFPQYLRTRIMRRFLGPAAGSTVRERIVGRVPVILESNIDHVVVRNGGVHMRLIKGGSTPRDHATEHVIAATGYRVDLRRLTFLSDRIRSEVAIAGNSPVLSQDFQSSVRGLYFVGLAAANSFGPLLRFTFGADFAARAITQHFINVLQDRSLTASSLQKAPGI
jgi:lysine/ornithine N-monooxygenase